MWLFTKLFAFFVPFLGNVGHGFAHAANRNARAQSCPVPNWRELSFEVPNSCN